MFACENVLNRICLEEAEQDWQGIAGGWGGIRTHEGLAPLPVFKTGAFNRSATHPVSNHMVSNPANRHKAQLLRGCHGKIADPAAVATRVSRRRTPTR